MSNHPGIGIYNELLELIIKMRNLSASIPPLETAVAAMSLHEAAERLISGVSHGESPLHLSHCRPPRVLLLCHPWLCEVFWPVEVFVEQLSSSVILPY